MSGPITYFEAGVSEIRNLIHPQQKAGLGGWMAVSTTLLVIGEWQWMPEWLGILACGGNPVWGPLTSE